MAGFVRESAWKMSTVWSLAWEGVPDFDLKNAETVQWDEWYSQTFEKLTHLTDFEELSEARKVVALLTKLVNVPASFLEMDDLLEIKYAELVSMLRIHCSPVNLRQLFFNRRQHPGESFEEFAECLEDLSRPCHFEEKDSLVRVIFTRNMHENYSAIKKALYIRSGQVTTLQETIILANALLLDYSKPGSDIGERVPVSRLNINTVRASGLTVSSRDTQDIKKSAINQGETIRDTEDIKTCEIHQTETQDLDCFPEDTEDVPQTGTPDNGTRIGISTVSNPCNTGNENLIDYEQAKCTKRSAREEFRQANYSSDSQFPNNQPSCTACDPKDRLPPETTPIAMHPSVRSVLIARFGRKYDVPDQESHCNSPRTTRGTGRNGTNDRGTQHRYNSAHPPIGRRHARPNLRPCSIADIIEPSFDVPAPCKVEQVPTPSVIHDKRNGITQPPIPYNYYTEVRVMYASPKGKLYVCPTSTVNDVIDNILHLNRWFRDPENHVVLKNCDKGSACASQYHGTWYRAKIVSEDSRNNGLLIQYCDFGNEELISDLTRLMALPQEFADAANFTFSIKNSFRVTFEEGDTLWILLLHEEADGTWWVSAKNVTNEVLSVKDVHNGAQSSASQVEYSPDCKFSDSKASSPDPELEQPEETKPHHILGAERNASLLRLGRMLDGSKEETSRNGPGTTRGTGRNMTNDHGIQQGHEPPQPPIVRRQLFPELQSCSIADIIEPSFDELPSPYKLEPVPTPSVIHDKGSGITQPPIPLNQYTEVRVMYASPKGKLYVCPTSTVNDVIDNILLMNRWFRDPKSHVVLKNCDKGAACATLYNDIWYRAKIVSEDSQNNGVFIQYCDFGHEDLISDFTRLMALPQEFAVPNFTFSIKNPLPATFEEGDLLWIKLLHEEADGTWWVSAKSFGNKVLSVEGSDAQSSAIQVEWSLDRKFADSQESSPTCDQEFEQPGETNPRDISDARITSHDPNLAETSPRKDGGRTQYGAVRGFRGSCEAKFNCSRQDRTNSPP